MRALFGLIINVNKDSNIKAKARTKDSGFVLKDNQGPKTDVGPIPALVKLKLYL